MTPASAQSLNLNTAMAGALPVPSEAVAASRGRSAGADWLRALAILLVMLWHLPAAATPAMLSDLQEYAWLGVDIFFVLSGYLIGAQLMTPIAQGRCPSLGGFYLRRAMRIFPAFFVVLFIYVCIPSARESPSMAPAWRF